MAAPPEHSRDQRASLHTMDGPTLLRALAGGAEALRQQADALNAINVFPIPDGDTGTNMSHTMRAGVEEAERAPRAASATAVAGAAAQGALMGAKGNSGVILSQIIAGIAALPGAAEELDGAALAAALDRGREAAYKVVSNPSEGTILTAISAAAAAARTAARDGADAGEVLAVAAQAAADAAARSPELLPMLKEAGVVDAGAQGLYVLLDGMLRGLRGDGAPAQLTDLGAIDASWLAAAGRTHADGARSGFCTEFVIHGAALDGDAIRAHLSTVGDSLLVVGGDGLVRAHLHTSSPEDALAYARSLGTLSHEKVDDMEAQFQSLAARAHAPATTPRNEIAIVAVGAGPGIEALFASMGASVVVPGGQTMNPSAGDIRAAIASTGAARAIVLPNNENVVLAAQQAAAGLATDVRVLPSRSIPEGVAALIAFSPEATLDENVEMMQAAAAAVYSGEVTLAARSTRLGGVDVLQGQPIVIIDGELELATRTVAEAVRGCVAIMLAACDGTLVTLYVGAGENQLAASELADELSAEFEIEVELVDGGQPHYPYLIGVE